MIQRSPAIRSLYLRLRWTAKKGTSTARPVGRMTRTGGGPVGGSLSATRGILHSPVVSVDRASVPTPMVMAAFMGSDAGSPMLAGPSDDGDVDPSILAMLTSRFLAGGVDPLALRLAGGGGGGEAIAAARRAVSRSPRCVVVLTRDKMTRFFPGFGGRSRD